MYFSVTLVLMPLGLWKSRWEIHREDMDRYRDEAERRDAKHQERTERIVEEMREDRAAANERWLRLGEEASELRQEFDRELTETRRFNRVMLVRLEKTYANLDTTLGLMGERIERMVEQIEANTAAVKGNTEEVRAQTDAIMKLLDHFKGPNGGPPV